MDLEVQEACELYRGEILMDKLCVEKMIIDRIDGMHYDSTEDHAHMELHNYNSNGVDLSPCTTDLLSLHQCHFILYYTHKVSIIQTLLTGCYKQLFIMVVK